MHRSLRPLAICGALLLALPAVAAAQGDIDKLNGAIDVAAHQQAGDLNSINGRIDVGEEAQVGQAQTVNGDIMLGRRARARDIEAVNGDVTLREHARVGRDVVTVNGAIRLDPDAEVIGHVSNVNGQITLDRAHVAGGLETTVGDITVGADSRVEGGILVKKTTTVMAHRRSHEPRIVIGPGAIVRGTLQFQRPVQLYVSSRAQIGTVKGATAQRFDADRP